LFREEAGFQGMGPEGTKENGEEAIDGGGKQGEFHGRGGGEGAEKNPGRNRG
jgi:hypothetical protein